MGVRLKGTELEYFPVPKIACTSIKQAVFAHNEPEVAATMRQPKSKDRNFISFVLDGRPYRSVHQLYPARRLGYHWWPRTDARLRFCVVRDPLERFLSG